MKSILCVALVGAVLLMDQTNGALPKGNPKPEKDKSSNLKYQTKGKFDELSSIIRDEGITGAWNVMKTAAVQEGKNQAEAWYKRFDFDLKDFQLGMAAGVTFGILEFVFREYFPTWSWVAYAYKLSLNQAPATLFTILSKIGVEIYH